eukprot:CCRYP_005935-RA/>CCRYP_005935-RA protein AED:0.01 eAED:0.01 QI:107/1/1/1/0.5/0.33/3/2235/595
MGKGYKLTSASGDGPKQCAFFFSDQGCRNGANCKFSHEADANATKAKNAAQPYVTIPTSVSSSSVMSSESESDGEIVETENRAGAYASLVKKGDDSNPFFSSTPVASPAPPPIATSSATKGNKVIKEEQSIDKKKKRKNSDTPFDLGENQPPANIRANQKGLAATASPVAAAPPKKPKQAATTPTNTNNLPPNNNCNFRNLKLPVASFSIPSSTDKEAEKATDTKSPPRPPTPQHEPAQPTPPLPLPIATPAHLKWSSAVIATRKHPNYESAFNFDKVQQNEFSQGISTPHHWISTRPYGDWCKNNPAAIAIDCEMCETRDPLTGKSDTKALCRLSVVNADDPNEVLLDTLVKPEWPVADYRTWVNGITKKDLDGVQFTLRHAQMFMNTLCSEQTVVVGHAVHNDLLALKMVHHCNVDTAMLYSHAPDDNENNTNGTPSLKNLAHGVLQKTMPNVHDSVNDARVALACAEHYVSKNGKVDVIEKVFARSHSGTRERLKSADTAVLLVHRLPRSSQPNHISDMFLAFTCIKPKNVADIVFSGKHGKCNVEFPTKEHAELAYITLTGGEHEDKTGKKQKRVKLKNGDYVCVRKMNKT